ncbi:S8 family serine peptidase [Catellatospora sp. KI3]|uniref:S8 family serine peptidase n=1 Tax=Catellatospora sp. KI3 TaxID=3041620 RepID=UPI002482AE25|nr:S8 family serine peptidase [Catellatospora sp. KI3]MDI1459850.1 S8 family serine peptidase [Catellatospora sp. KI3]
MKLLSATALGVALALNAVPAAAAEPDVVRGLQWQFAALDLPSVHQRADGSGIVVAVLDSGVDATHPDLVGQVLAGPDAQATTDVDGRGTELAGLIAGRGHVVQIIGEPLAPASPTPSSSPSPTPSASAQAPGLAPSPATVPPADDRPAGVRGVAPGAKILPVAFAPAAGATGEPDRLADAIDYAVSRDVKIICIGRGVAPSSRLQASVDAAVARGVLIIAADSAKTGRPFTPWPVSYPGVLGAIAADRTGAVPVLPVSGQTTGITVPGVDLISTDVGGGYHIDEGGASAAAVLAGAAAVIWSAYPRSTAAQVVQRMRTTALDRGADGPDSRYGAGALNLNAALSLVLPEPSVTPSPALAPSLAPSPSPSASPRPVALADSGDWRRWLVVLPLLGFLAALGLWSHRTARRTSRP